MFQHARCTKCDYIQPLIQPIQADFVCSVCGYDNTLAERVLVYHSGCNDYVLEKAGGSHYKVIGDEAALKRFIAWLPELLPSERYYLTLMARRKYCPTLNAPDIIIKRILGKKDELFNRIRQLEVPMGSYTTKNGEVIQQEALALYININPRSLVTATKSVLRELIDAVLCDTKLETVNPQSLVWSEVHKARGTKHFVDIDIDDPGLKAEHALSLALAHVNQDAISVVQTRGGVHLVIATKKTQTKDWFPKLRAKFVFDVVGDNMIPVPGGYQGGFVPLQYNIF